MSDTTDTATTGSTATANTQPPTEQVGAQTAAKNFDPVAFKQKTLAEQAAREEQSKAEGTAKEEQSKAEESGKTPEPIFVLPGEYPDPLPDDQDPDALFPNGFARRGHAGMLFGESGIGKSTFCYQAAFLWCNGLGFNDWKPVRPLKVAMIQAEDDDKEMGTFKLKIGRDYLLGSGKITQEQFDHAMTGGGFTTIKVKPPKPGETYKPLISETFAAFLRPLADRFDLIIINPLQAYAGIDISRPKEASVFCRQWIQPVIEGKCAVLFVHHTNKRNTQPNSSPNNQPLLLSLYDCAGAADLINWLRFSLSISKRDGDDFFYLAGVKRGRRLHWETADGEPTTIRKIAYRKTDSDPDALGWIDLGGVSITEAKSGRSNSSPEDMARKMEAKDAAKAEAEIKVFTNYAKRAFALMTDWNEKRKERGEAPSMMPISELTFTNLSISHCNFLRFAKWLRRNYSEVGFGAIFKGKQARLYDAGDLILAAEARDLIENDDWADTYVEH